MVALEGVDQMGWCATGGDETKFQEKKREKVHERILDGTGQVHRSISKPIDKRLVDQDGKGGGIQESRASAPVNVDGQVHLGRGLKSGRCRARLVVLLVKRDHGTEQSRDRSGVERTTPPRAHLANKLVGKFLDEARLAGVFSRPRPQLPMVVSGERVLEEANGQRGRGGGGGLLKIQSKRVFSLGEG